MLMTKYCKNRSYSGQKTAGKLKPPDFERIKPSTGKMHLDRHMMRC